MAKVALQIADPADRYTLKAMLETAGHTIVEDSPDVWISDSAPRAIETAARAPSLILTAAAGVPEAVDAMHKGVYGYIFRPLQPGEAGIMVARALGVSGGAPAAHTAPADPMPLAEVEREHILRVFRQCKHNHSATARLLGIGRNTLWRKLKQYGIQ